MDFAVFQHSVFLQALGSAILNSIWQGLILWVFYEGIVGFYKCASARMKHNLGFILVLCSFVWFLAGFVSELSEYKTLNDIFSIAGSTENNANQSLTALDGIFISLKSSLPYLSVAYIFLFSFLTVRLLTTYRKVYLISHKGLMHPPSELFSFTNQLRQRMGISRKINLWVSNFIDIPATIGFIKPIILIPLASLNNLSEVQLEAIILHELSHIKRNDYFTNLLVSIIETVLFFNPFVILLTKVIRQERENCCDDFVLEYKYDPLSYASALLRLARSGPGKLHLSLGAVSGKKHLLLSRIKRITKDRVISTRYNFGQKILAFIFVTAVFCLLAWLSPKKQKSKNDLVQKKEQLFPPSSTILSSIGSINTSNHPKKNQKLIISGNRSPENEKDPSGDIEKYLRKNEEITRSLMDENGLPPEMEKALSETATKGMPHSETEINNIKLPPSINIKNFPFKEMNLSITRRHPNPDKLNDDLKRVYTEVDGIDWNKMEMIIDESLSHLKNAGLSQKEFSQVYAEAEKALEKVKFVRPKLFENKSREEVRHQIEVKETEMKKKIDLLADINKQIQLAFAKLQNNKDELKEVNLNFDFHYDVDEEARN